ncbi:hypothetical protein [Lederbergia graminis]|uniref:Uncharacterized protein n=1 Tax=Lederbergia graminis TaxID=735518 RepID=A0ABW0LN17_9BACI
MKFSTAKWMALIFVAIAVIFIGLYFYLDAQDSMIPLLRLLVRPVGAGTLLFAAFIMLASLMAQRKKQEQITIQNFLGSFLILVCLIGVRLIGNSLK